MVIKCLFFIFSINLKKKSIPPVYGVKEYNLIKKKFVGLGARAVLIGLILPVFVQKQPFRLAPFAGGKKFATQIPPILNF